MATLSEATPKPLNNAAVPAPEPGPHPQRSRRDPRINKPRAPAPQMPDQLAEARSRKTAQRAAVTRYVDERLVAMEHQETYTVPMLYVAVTGSLAPAHLLCLVAQWSERAFAATGSGWVRQHVQTWVNFSGLDEQDWTVARGLLRERGLIVERRRYDIAAGEIVTEIAFVPSVFAAELARVREELTDDARARLRDGLPL